jgi:hydrogenase maturation protease
MKTLVLGYGNPSRGDDGVGWHVVRDLQARHLSTVELMTAHQLDLEFAEIVSGFDAVYFVDAAVADSSEAVACTEIRPRVRPHTTTHHLLPGDVLALCACLYGAEPRGVLYSIRGETFEFTDDISPAASEAARRVADEIAGRISGGQREHGQMRAGQTA